VDDTLIVGNGVDKLIGGDNNTGSNVTLGTGDDTVIGGNFNTDVTITLGNGNDVFKAGNNDTGSNITLGSGTDTIYNSVVAPTRSTMETITRWPRPPSARARSRFMMSEVTTRMIPSTSMELLCIMSTAEITTRIMRPFSATTM
jgi:hypothetical protein